MKMLKLFRYVWVIGGKHHPSTKWYKMNDYKISNLNYTSSIHNSVCLCDDVSWYIEFRDVIE